MSESCQKSYAATPVKITSSELKRLAAVTEHGVKVNLAAPTKDLIGKQQVVVDGDVVTFVHRMWASWVRWVKEDHSHSRVRQVQFYMTYIVLHLK